jgi:pentatricopeptide repeat protein
MMAGYGTLGKFFEAQELIKDMQKRRIRPNEYTFTSLTEAFINAGVYAFS